MSNGLRHFRRQIKRELASGSSEAVMSKLDELLVRIENTERVLAFIVGRMEKAGLMPPVEETTPAGIIMPKGVRVDG